MFFSGTWAYIGMRYDLGRELSRITDIPMEICSNGFNPMNNHHTEIYCVANRLGWGCSRETTRPEDKAYSLMGRPILLVRWQLC